jgi:hypothetical protein
VRRHLGARVLCIHGQESGATERRNFKKKKKWTIELVLI